MITPEQFINEASRLGIIIDVLGAILVAKAVFYIKNEDAFNTSGAFIGYSGYHTKEKIKAKYEAMVGSALLIIGFIGQYLGTFSNDARQANFSLDIIITITCILLLVATLYLAEKVADFQTRRLIKGRQDGKRGKNAK